MPTTKKGEKITYDEFFKRWRRGIEEITPYQKIKTQLLANYISLIGIISGLIIVIFNLKRIWWVGMILMGALMVIVIQLIGLKQQKYQLDKINKFSEEKSLEEVFKDEK